jgi:hypothetical protein
MTHRLFFFLFQVLTKHLFTANSSEIKKKKIGRSLFILLYGVLGWVRVFYPKNKITGRSKKKKNGMML